MRRSVERESQSTAFSHLVIEGMEKERSRIARELHDSILPQIRGMEVSDQLRSICRELKPPDFSRLSLKDSIADLCNKFSEKTGIECAYSIEKEISFAAIDKDDQLHIYRVIQEAFTNIEKHSKAGKAILVSRRINKADRLNKKSSGDILICISDDGVGFDGIIKSSGNIIETDTEGFGIKNMCQRAAIIGAKIDFISDSGNGFMVTIELNRKKDE
jgi:two-component system NarL family sensor kinase